MEPHIGFLVAATAIAAIAAVWDAKTGHIPNALSFATIVLSPPLHVLIMWQVQGATKEDALWYGGGFSLFGAVVSALVPLFMWRQSALGGGDVKLFIALGALMQMQGLETQMYAFVFAALIAPAQLAYQGKLGTVLKNSGQILANAFLPKDRRKTIEAETATWFRLGPSIFLGAALTTFVHWKDL